MYCVIYEFKVKHGRAEDFEGAWALLTQAIYRVCGSLGSRLHKTSDPLLYIAYAQWPSRQQFETRFPESAFDVTENEARALLKASTESIRQLYGLELKIDLFAEKNVRVTRDTSGAP